MKDFIYFPLKSIHTIFLLFLIMGGLGTNTNAQQLAFPGAEGFGRFTTGGRGGRVIEVTNLNDSGAGSLRAAVQASDVRTIVFRVSGTIALESPLRIRNGNLTIAGQTAPGDGICLRNYDVSVDADNVIIRYLRIRLGDEKQIEADALGGRGRQDIIIDHCSASWSVDECVSFYDNRNVTVQWCLISESLRNSVHAKGAHGYGGIWGGYDCSFHHNLLAHHSSRTPRFNGVSPAPAENTDARNNVIYNWGFNSAYGGESGKINMVANYYKSGPATGPKNRILEPSDASGEWYVAENYVYGFPEITADNWAGGVQGNFANQVLRKLTPHPFGPVVTHTAETAYELVLADAGTTKPRRDTLDARIIMEVRLQTALYGGAFTGPGTGIIDSQNDVGGWPELNTYDVPIDADHDGMADDWEVSNGLNPADVEDRNGDFNGDGYTNLEKYLNSLCLREDYLLAPAELIATAVSPSQIDLTWKEAALGEEGFMIERSPDSPLNFVEIAMVGANETRYQDSGITPATTYFYRVRAYRKNYSSAATNIAGATTINADGTALPASHPIPADNGLEIPVYSILQWEPGTAAVSHDVYFGTTNPPEFICNQQNPEFDPHGLADSTTYYWRIDEVNASGKTTGPVWHFTTAPFHPALIAWWTFDQIASLVRDATGHQLSARLNNMARENWIDGFSRLALAFDGQDDFLNVFHDELINFHIRGFAISFWIKQSEPDQIAPYLSKREFKNNGWGSGYEIAYAATETIRFVVADSTVESEVTASASTVITGEWQFLTAVRDVNAKTVSLYLNGEVAATAPDSTWNISNTTDLLIGTNGGRRNYFNGALDELRLYNYPLTAVQVRQLYESALTGLPIRNLPEKSMLSTFNNPNPFNPVTRIVYSIPRCNHVSLNLFNLLGQEVLQLVDEIQLPGEHSVRLDGSNLQSGIYFYRLEVGREIINRKIIMIK